MYCSVCGKKNPEDAGTCSKCGAVLGPASGTPAGAYLPNYLAPAVVVTIFCCMPLGLVALIFAAQVNGRQIAGELEKARESSKSARLWCWIAFGVGIVFWTLYITLVIALMIFTARKGI
jgi:predicted nucleic acid-binding Zn ribbon protein